MKYIKHLCIHIKTYSMVYGIRRFNAAFTKLFSDSYPQLTRLNSTFQVLPLKIHPRIFLSSASTASMAYPWTILKAYMPSSILAI